MKLAFFGTGYVGLVSGTCLASQGHDVLCVDIDEKKVATMQRGTSPLYEPGLEKLMKDNMQKARLRFTTNAKEAVDFADVIFLCLPTPSAEDGSVDLSYVETATETIAKHMAQQEKYKVIVDKSTVPPGTANKVRSIIEKYYDGDFDVVSNPEFLREGAAVDDFLRPDRVVVGADSDRAMNLMKEVYRGIIRQNRPFFGTGVVEAETIKYAANSFLAVKISYANEIAKLCDSLGADVKNVMAGVGLDDRIGPRFLQAGIGYGGSCFPKDVKGILHIAKEHGVNLSIINAAHKANDAQREYVLEALRKKCGGSFAGKKIGILGLAFKPETDDIREAPALTLIDRILSDDGTVTAYDPEAMENVKKQFPDISYASSAYDVATDADAIILVTEWKEFNGLDMDKVKELMTGDVFVDARNFYDPKTMRKYGFDYCSVGRP